MTALAHTQPPPAITPAAERDIRWLQKTLKRQFRGWVQEGDGSFRFDLVRTGGKFLWIYGATLEQAAARARREVELIIAGGRP